MRTFIIFTFMAFTWGHGPALEGAPIFYKFTVLPMIGVSMLIALMQDLKELSSDK